jgi:hypothetical protein
VEAGLDDFIVNAFQGSHFFHNLTSAGTAYMTVNPPAGPGFIDWEWLATRSGESDADFVRHVRLKTPIEARIDGRTSRAVVLKEPVRTGADV